MADLVDYATTEDLSSWVDTEPDNVVSLLRSASIRVAKACNISPYQTPDPSSTDALRDATCAQVASWVALGVDPAKSGTDLPGPVKVSALLDARIERDTSAATKLLETVTEDLCEDAVAILLQAGLLYVPVPLGADPNDTLPRWGTAGPTWSPFTDPLSGELQYPYGGEW